jgi:putative membrane protein
MYGATLPGICSLFAFVAAEPAAAQQRVDAVTFVRMVGASDAFEVQSSQLALQRSASPRVQAFARQMINDPSATFSVLQQSAPMPVAFSSPFGMLDPRHAGMLSQLAALNGPSFERLYVQMQLAGHRQAVALFSSYVASGDDPRLVSFARTTAFATPPSHGPQPLSSGAVVVSGRDFVIRRWAVGRAPESRPTCT